MIKQSSKQADRRFYAFGKLRVAQKSVTAKGNENPKQTYTGFNDEPNPYQLGPDI
jgi:hypothetical protein